RARRSCSRRTTSRRPSSSATTWPSSTTGRSWPRGRAPSWPPSSGSRASRTPTWSWSGARSSRGPTSRRTSKRRTRRERRADQVLLAPAAGAEPLPEDQAPDRRRAAAGDVPLHLRVRRRARLADRHAARVRLRRVHRPGADHDGLGDQRVLEQLVLDPAAEVPARDRRPAVLARLTAAAAAGVLARRLRARDDGRDAHLHRVLDPDRRAPGERARAAPGAVPRRLLLRPDGRADRGARGAVRRRLVRADVRAAAADLPRGRLLLGVAAARA